MIPSGEVKPGPSRHKRGHTKAGVGEGPSNGHREDREKEREGVRESGTERLFLAEQGPPLDSLLPLGPQPCYWVRCLSLHGKDTSPQRVCLGDDSDAWGLGLSYTVLTHIRTLCPFGQGHVPVITKIVLHTGARAPPQALDCPPADLSAKTMR